MSADEDRRRVAPLREGTSELDVLAAEAKAGTEHAEHPGWTFAYPERVLRCGCGAALAGSGVAPSGVLRIAPDGTVYVEGQS